MEQISAEIKTVPYENSLQYLQDELKRLDLLVHKHIRMLRKERQGQAAEEYRGLFISEGEIDEILKKDIQHGWTIKKEASSSPDVYEIDSYVQKLNMHISGRIAASMENGIYISLRHLSAVFHLTQFETDCILICLAPSIDLKYEKLYAYINNDVTKKGPTVDLILQLLCSTIEERTRVRSFFSDDAPLRKFHLLDFIEEEKSRQAPLISRQIRLDERIAGFILGDQGIDSRIRQSVQVLRPRHGMSGLIIPEEAKRKIDRLFGPSGGPWFLKKARSLFYLKGTDRNGQQQAAEAICFDLGLLLMIVEPEMLQGQDSPSGIALDLILREAVLRKAAIYIKGFGRFIEEGISGKLFLQALDAYHGLIFLQGEKGWQPKTGDAALSVFEIKFPVPSFAVRKQLWSHYLNGKSVGEGLDIDALSNKFLLTRGQVKDAIHWAMNVSLLGGSGNSHITMEALRKGCCHASNQKLGSLSKKIQPIYTWDDIVLPEEKHCQLKEMSNYVKFRHIVYGDWGFDRKLSLGKGLNALFHGPSGTGKTMASEVVARDLGLDLYKIDLSSVISKYIGETEKNLSAIFKEAETSNAVLFFDEADALFGKRSEVKDAHDRYANIEVAYLLQKMEEYEGIVILATNLMNNMDDAFVRRMHFSVEFPFPDESHRLKIWEKVFPEKAPVDKDIDFGFLAGKFKIAGGNIKNIALCAAFLAADDSGRIGMKHTIMAAKREFQKMGKLIMQADFGKYHNLAYKE